MWSTALEACRKFDSMISVNNVTGERAADGYIVVYIEIARF